MPYSVDRVIVDHSERDQQFRGSIITSLSVHVGLAIVLLVGPLVWPQAPIMPNIVPVNIVMPPAASPPPAAEVQPPAAAEEPEAEAPEPEAAPEPEPEAPEPEPVPRSLEDLQREQEAADEAEREAEAERQRIADEERRQREAEAERRRQAEEERQREEEEARRRQPQKAARRGATPPQQQSAQRSAIDLTSAEDDSRGFTVEEFPYADYLGRIRDLIASRWSPPPRGPYSPQRRAEVFFRIGRNGQLVVQPRMSNASGESLFDRAAMQAIAQASPFPPLPREYQGQSLGVGLAFVQE
jgi:colicin import membrane protein